jgi:hypothetical protein
MVSLIITTGSTAQLTQIKMYHRLHDALSLRTPKLDVVGHFSDEECECQIV